MEKQVLEKINTKDMEFILNKKEVKEMAKKRTKKQFEEMRKMAYGGALAIKSTDLIKHARQPASLEGDIRGFAGIGVAGVMSEVAAKPLDMIYGNKKRKRKRR